MPYRHFQIKADTKTYDKFTGKYGEIEILKIDGKLYYNNAETELLPESKTKFFRTDNHDRTIEFIKDKSGNYNSLAETKGGGVKETVKKTPPND